MQENLVGYLLNSLDDASHREVESQLRVDPEARRQAALLRDGLEPLEADNEVPMPPPGLAARTLARLAQSPARTLPRAPVLAGSGAGNGRPFWRRVDYLVAASLLFIAVGIGMQGIYRLSFGLGAATLQCQENLRQFATGLMAYRDMHGRFPDVTAVATPRPAAGMVVPILLEAGVLPGDISVRCPGNGAPENCRISVGDLANMSLHEFERQLSHLTSCYAYSLGYRDSNGVYHGPNASNDRPGALVPLLADGPPPHVRDGNSPNHHGRGQNVLFHDGHVRFTSSRLIDGDDDIYLNFQNRVAAGVGRLDAVLGNSSAQP